MNTINLSSAQSAENHLENKMMKQRILHLHLKKKWFDKIKSGEKLEEYRIIKEHYISLFTDGLIVDQSTSDVSNINVSYKLKEFDKVILYLAYPNANDKESMVAFKDPKIRIDFGKEEWGAPKFKVFVVSWGERIDV